ncbi:integrin alpha-5-like [Diadema antillarum]|uniref:integrin alpha-5-like n=1 Tax=Diadema antillarum TaxID=105358 RepID=UPI003A8551F9
MGVQAPIFPALLLLITLTIQITAFNVDTSSPLIYRGPSGSYFGYAVDLHSEGNENMLLVGAPRAQTDEVGLHEGGALYRCSLDPSMSSFRPPTTPQGANESTPSLQCSQVIFDSSGEELKNKSGGMFGATVDSSGPDGTVIVCHPLSTQFQDQFGEPTSYRYVEGGCVFARQNFSVVHWFSACISRVSLLILWHNTIKTEWIIAGVNRNYGQGTVHRGNHHDFGNVVYTGFVNSQDYDDEYRGYSVSFGDFFGDGVPEIMAGIPRGQPDLNGRVEFYDRNLRRYYVLDGYQHGAGFGHSLLSADLNNDGSDDVIIGAPMHSAFETPIRDGWEVGRIYVYYSDGNGDFLVEQTITGQYPGGRFGFALAAIGDINQDGNQDVAVSSPYFGDGKEGRVSIHLGLGERGLSSTATQHISPSQFGVDLTSFGFALASGMDIDNNSYPDLVIGSYQSDAAVVLRSRPVVSFGVRMSLNGSAGIDLENRDLVLNDGSAVSSFNIYLCLHYTGPAVPEILDFSCTLTCDFRRQHPRAVFLIPNGEDSAILHKTVTLTKDVLSCMSYTAYVLNSIRQKLQPIKIKFDYDIAANPSNAGDGGILPPILNASTRYYRKLSVPILRDCNGTVCVPDLSISATPISQVPLIVGAEGAVVIRTIILNKGEDAYESVLNFTEPRDFFFTRAVQRTENEERVTCTKDHASKSGEFSCLLGNPMKADEMIVLELQFATDSVSGDRSNVSFRMDVSRVSQTEFVFYEELPPGSNRTAPSKEGEIPLITHRYEILNEGPSKLGETEVTIRLPHSTFDPKSQLMVLESAEVEGGEPCNISYTEPTQTASTWTTDATSAVTTATMPAAVSTTKGQSSTTPYYRIDRPPARRRRRRSQGSAANVTANDMEVFGLEDFEVVDCLGSEVDCYSVMCTIPLLGTRKTSERDTASIIVTSRLLVDVLRTTASSRALALTSDATLNVVGSAYRVHLQENITATAKATTRIAPRWMVVTTGNDDDNTAEIGVELGRAGIWAVVGACLAGVAVLIVTNLILYKVGFFKRQQIGIEEKPAKLRRNKPDRMSIRQRSVIFDD